VLEQAALAGFIAEGHFARHLRRMRVLYTERRAVLLEAAAGLPLETDSPPAAIHCIGWLPEGTEARDFARCALEAGLQLTPVSDFSIEPPEREGALLGYGGFNEADIRTALSKLAEIF